MVTKNNATVFSAELAEMKTRKFAIVPTPEKSGTNSMAPRSDKPPKDYLGDRLKDYLLEVMNERNLSFQKIEDNARSHDGATLGRGTIQQIAKGDTTNPGIFTLLELSWGIEKPLEEVMKITLGGLLLNPEMFDKSLAGRVWAKVDELPAAEQRIIKRYLQMIEREILRLSSCD